MALNGKGVVLLLILAGILAAATVRLTAYTDTTSTYSSDSNKQLKNRALGLVQKIRGLVDSYNTKDQELMTDFQTNYLASRTTERQEVRDQYERKLKDANNSTVRDYKESLLAESKAVRAELHRRLPERLYRSNLSKIYENPSFVMEIQIIADDLELLSKSLPDT